MSNRLFKRLSRDNWRQEEPHIQHYVRISPIGTETKPTADDLTALISTPELSKAVPCDIRNLVEVAQGAMCYGSLFYPMFTLGYEQMWRVMEAALISRATDLGAPPSTRKSFSRALNWFDENCLLPPERIARWNSARAMRNMSSHAKQQSLVDAMMAVTAVTLAREFINELYVIES